MSRARKKTRGNPAKADQRKAAHAEAYTNITEFMLSMGEASMETAREGLLAKGVTEDEIDYFIKMMRLRIAGEALSEGLVDVFEWVMAPVANEMDVLALLEEKRESEDAVLQEKLREIG